LIPRQGDAHRNDRFVIFREEDEGGQATVTTDEKTSAVRRLHGDQLMQIGKLSITENFVISV